MMTEKEYLANFLRPFTPIFGDVITQASTESFPHANEGAFVENCGLIFPELYFNMNQTLFHNKCEPIKILKHLKIYQVDKYDKQSNFYVDAIPLDSLLSTNATN